MVEWVKRAEGDAARLDAAAEAHRREQERQNAAAEAAAQQALAAIYGPWHERIQDLIRAARQKWPTQPPGDPAPIRDRRRWWQAAAQAPTSSPPEPVPLLEVSIERPNRAPTQYNYGQLAIRQTGEWSWTYWIRHWHADVEDQKASVTAKIVNGSPVFFRNGPGRPDDHDMPELKDIERSLVRYASAHDLPL